MPASTRLTPAERRLRARIAANTRWALASEDDRQLTARRGQDGLLARFERQVDPDGTMAPAERAKRVDNAYRAHMSRISLARSKARKGGARGGT